MATKDYDSTDYQGNHISNVVIDNSTLNSPTLVTPTINNATIINPILTGGNNDSVTISNIIVEKAWSFTFDATAANQKLDIYCTNTNGLESLLDVTVTTSSGTLIKRFALQKQGTGMIQSGARYAEVIGTVADYLAISDLLWDTVNLRWIFKIVNRSPFGVSTNASISIKVVATTPTASTLVSYFGMGSIYTTDTTTYTAPNVQFSGAITADALITNFVKKGVNYTVASADSIIMTTAGITITLPAPALVGIGRNYTIKNLQNSATTVVAVGGALIDSASSHTVGNKRTYTYCSDGTAYWITSAF